MIMMKSAGIFLFFFSSRRRHTRFDCDWSSDVCSSDLFRFTVQNHEPAPEPRDYSDVQLLRLFRPLHNEAKPRGRILARSEERRVGKECRAWWSPYSKKEKKTADMRRCTDNR